MAAVSPKTAAVAARPLTKQNRRASFAWIFLPVLACALALWVHGVRAKRVGFVSAVGEPPIAASAETSSQPIWQPRLIVPEHDNASYEWLAQTQQMFARHEWRIRKVDYENAPLGHEVDETSPYRWWLGSLVWIDHVVSGRPTVAALEHIALWADPLLQIILLISAVGIVAWKFGRTTAGIVAAAFVTLFPLGLSYLPAAPSAAALIHFGVFWSVLPLIIGVRTAMEGEPLSKRSATIWFCLAGAAGGVGLWIDTSMQFPVVVGTGAGAVFAALIGRRRDETSKAVASDQPLPWLAWAVTGALVTGLGYFVEFYPGFPDNSHLRTIHPLYGLAWIGLGLIAEAVSSGLAPIPTRGVVRRMVMLIIGVVALAALPWLMWRKHTWGFLDVEVAVFRLSRLTVDTPATGLLGWALRDGVTPRFWATVLPLALMAPAGWWLLFRNGSRALRIGMTIVLGPLLVAVGFACKQLSWWSTVDVLATVLLVPVVTIFVSLELGRIVRWSYATALGILFCLGFGQIFPRAEARGAAPLTEAETLTLVERDLARWLTLHIGHHDGVVLAPHNQAITLYYYGGLRGLATLSKENVDGLGAAVRIVSASTPEEAKELIDSRGVTHLVLPSWDSYLETYTRMGMGKVEGTFFERLSVWRLPPWLKPVPYQLPTIAGFEGNSVTIFEVVEDQNDASSLSRIAEYFLEVQQPDRAANTAQLLRRFPADLGALTARAQVEYARGDTENFKKTLESIQRRIASGSDRAMAWDRRVSLSVVLAEAKQTDLARERVKRCISEATEARIRSLTTGQLYRLLVLARAYGLEFKETALTELALSLVPEEMRAKVEPKSERTQNQ